VNRLGLDAIYVLNVRAYTDRRAHVERELARFGLEAEFILDFDVPDLTPELEARWFGPGCWPGRRWKKKAAPIQDRSGSWWLGWRVGGRSGWRAKVRPKSPRCGDRSRRFGC
jgi:hypothetical protein